MSNPRILSRQRAQATARRREQLRQALGVAPPSEPDLSRHEAFAAGLLTQIAAHVNATAEANLGATDPADLLALVGAVARIAEALVQVIEAHPFADPESQPEEHP